jgi:hypothetical protein
MVLAGVNGARHDRKSGYLRFIPILLSGCSQDISLELLLDLLLRTEYLPCGWFRWALAHKPSEAAAGRELLGADESKLLRPPDTTKRYSHPRIDTQPLYVFHFWVLSIPLGVRGS